MPVHPFLAKLNALLGQQSRGTDPQDPDVAGASADGGSSGSQGVSSTSPAAQTVTVPDDSQIKYPTPIPGGPQYGPAAPQMNSQAPNIQPSNPIPPVQSSDSALPTLAPQGPKNKFLSLFSRLSGMTAAQPKPGQVYEGPTTTEGKLDALGHFLGKASSAYEENFGTPLDRELAMQRRQLGNEAAWRAAMIGVKAQGNEINQQKADTAQQKMTGDMRRYGYTLNDPNDPSSGFRSLTEPEILSDPELNAKFQAQMSKVGLNDAQTDKVRDMLLGRFDVDPWIAAVAGDPNLSGQKVSAQQFQQIGKVLQAKGIQIKDLGQEGMWALDRIGNKIHQVSAMGPSVARAQMYAMLRPVQAITPEGDLQWMTAGNAISQGAAPAGAGASAISKQAQMQDVKVASQNLRQAINGMQNPIAPDTLGELTLAMHSGDPSVFQTEIQSLFGSRQLDQSQYQFLTWLGQLQERAMSLRNIAGMGAASDKLRDAIIATLPAAKDANRDLMTTKLDAFDNMVMNLEKGIPHVGKKPQSSGAKLKPTGWK